MKRILCFLALMFTAVAAEAACPTGWTCYGWMQASNLTLLDTGGSSNVITADRIRMSTPAQPTILFYQSGVGINPPAHGELLFDSSGFVFNGIGFASPVNLTVTGDLTVNGTVAAGNTVFTTTNIIWQTNTFLQGTNIWTGTNTFTGTVNYNGPITTQGQMGGTSNVPMGGITMVFVNGFWIKNQ